MPRMQRNEERIVVVILTRISDHSQLDCVLLAGFRKRGQATKSAPAMTDVLGSGFQAQCEQLGYQIDCRSLITELLPRHFMLAFPVAVFDLGTTAPHCPGSTNRITVRAFTLCGSPIATTSSLTSFAAFRSTIQKCSYIKNACLNRIFLSYVSDVVTYFT